jgi:hypothetical protein
MDTTSVAYVLCRIEDDASLTPISAPLHERLGSEGHHADNAINLAAWG